MGPEEKALKAHVTARALLCWGLYLAQACCRICKVLDDLNVTAFPCFIARRKAPIR